MTKISTSREFAAARERLNLSQATVARIMDKSPRTVRHWEGVTPDATACRVMEWMVDGFRPPQFKTKGKINAA